MKLYIFFIILNSYMNNYIYENISQMMKYFIGENTLSPYILGGGGKIGHDSQTGHDMI